MIDETRPEMIACAYSHRVSTQMASCIIGTVERSSVAHRIQDRLVDVDVFRDLTEVPSRRPRGQKLLGKVPRRRRV
jgi:hypothetical protein